MKKRRTIPNLPGGVGRRCRGFTLLELMVVIGIIGILAAVATPAFRGLGQNNVRSAAARQMLDDLGFARQMAIKNRSRVYVAFLPPNQLNTGSPLFRSSYQNIQSYVGSLPNAEVREQLRNRYLRALTNAFSGQYTSYAIIARRALGDQPGQGKVRYLTEWRSLPDGMVFPDPLFRDGIFNGTTNLLNAFANRTRLPFPMAMPELTGNSPNLLQAELPAIAFTATGQLDLDPQVRANLGIRANTPLPDVYLALSSGSVFLPRTAAVGANVAPEYNLDGNADLVETPPNNYTNSLIRLAALTGRARMEKPRLQP